MKTALITGINGQDGSYLAELLVDKGYKVIGILRRHSLPQFQSARLDDVGLFRHEKVELVYGDVTDLPSLMSVFVKYHPDEVYNLAAQSHVGISFDQPAFTAATIVTGTLNILECVRHITPEARVYLAGSSEMYGNNCDFDDFRRESTEFEPVSPYGCAKLHAYHLGRTYRDSYGLFICNGILFNHESPRRGLNFVTNKVVDGALRIDLGLADNLVLGDIDVSRDWGHAKDYVKAMWKMLQHFKPDDYVCATGVSHTVRELCAYVFACLDMDYLDYVVRDSERYMRPIDVVNLRGDSTKLRKTLGWTTEYTFESMLDEMIDARREVLISGIEKIGFSNKKKSAS